MVITNKQTPYAFDGRAAVAAVAPSEAPSQGTTGAVASVSRPAPFEVREKSQQAPALAMRAAGLSSITPAKEAVAQKREGHGSARKG